ncbi:MAG: phosphoribosylpyrophosphate synthetase [Flavobacteriales bacterium]|nr:phosphoribosylpyrophosphate synthetase [Flavobacteriales bacterium]|tara:strand:+ start:235 stop:540 length:306 start_codon:yes stop_codon:yes gene_type:complete
MNNQYQTLSQASKALASQGFVNEIEIKNDKEAIIDGEVCNVENMDIVEFHRFEGMSNPADSSVIYAIEDKEKHCKGVLIEAFGVDASQAASSLLKNLELER